MGIKSPTLQPPPAPPKGGEEPHPTSPKGEECLCAHEGDKKSWFFLLIISANTCKLVSSPFGEVGWGFHSPPFGGVGGGCRGGFLYLYLSLCKTDSYKGICRTCYSSTPQNDCFLNKVAYLCKQKRKSLTNSPTRPLPRGEECRSQDKPQDV